MKTFMIGYFLLVSSQLVRAQMPDMSGQCKEQMAQLAYLAGDWQGEAIVHSPSGVQHLNQSEHVAYKLDDLVLSIEGTGRQADKVTFHAFAILNYDPLSKAFKLRSIVKEGLATDAYFKVLGENKFQWGFDIPNAGKTRYSITLDPSQKTWTETGEYSADGINWMKVVEMNLTKQ